MSLPVTVETDFGSSGQRFKLASEAVDAIDKALDHTVKTGREAGFYFCGRDEKGDVALHTLSPAEYCEGDSCSVRLRQGGCAPIVGSLHTHPSMNPQMSPLDMLHGVYTKLMGGETAFGQGPYCRAVVDDRGVPIAQCNHILPVPAEDLRHVYTQGGALVDLVSPIYAYKRAHDEWPSASDPAFTQPFAAYAQAEAILTPVYSKGSSADLPIDGLMPDKRLRTLVVDLERWGEKIATSQFESLCASKARQIEIFDENNRAFRREADGAERRANLMYSPVLDHDRARIVQRVAGYRESCDPLSDEEVLAQYDEAVAQEIADYDEAERRAQACTGSRETPESLQAEIAYKDGLSQERRVTRLSMEASLRDLNERIYDDATRTKATDTAQRRNIDVGRVLQVKCGLTDKDLSLG